MELGERKTVALLDREREKKKLNDRLLIRKVMDGMEDVCPVCLEAVAGKTLSDES